ncbi:BnaA04g24840D [Brassica napus]|uniref:BnaA04g24840D protein n=1 Tax=Brassica napus TaxID=3708 RepID=A0A078H0M5_BRANA|nr:BnaA04g24840D [Brassica napus]
MRANLRSLVAKAYRVRQGRTFSSSSTTNPINYKGDISIYEYLFSRGLVSFIGFGVASCITGDSVSKFDEELKAIDKDAVDFLEKRGKLPPGSLDAIIICYFHTTCYHISRGTYSKHAYRVRQGRTFSSSSSSAPNPIDDKGGISIYEWLLPRGFATLTGFVVASYFTGDSASKFDEMVKEYNKDAAEFLEKRGKLPPSWVDSAYRVRQGRTFSSSSSSSAPNPIDDKGKRSVITPVWEYVNRLAPWFIGGYVFKFGLEISALMKSKLKSIELHEEYLREFERYHQEKEQSRSLRPVS